MSTELHKACCILCDAQLTGEESPPDYCGECQSLADERLARLRRVHQLDGLLCACDQLARRWARYQRRYPVPDPYQLDLFVDGV